MASAPSWGLGMRGRCRERGTAVKTTCCKSYQRKGKACKKCPVMAHLAPKALKPGRKHKK